VPGPGTVSISPDPPDLPCTASPTRLRCLCAQGTPHQLPQMADVLATIWSKPVSLVQKLSPRDVKWTRNAGPLDRGVFVNALPHFNRGHGNDSRPKGRRPQESVAEVLSAHSPSRLEDALETFFNGPRPPGLRPKTKAAGLSSAGMGWRAERPQ